MEKRMNKDELIELLNSLKIDKEEFYILSSSALVLRDLFPSAGDLDLCVSEIGLQQLSDQFNLKRKDNGWYDVSDKVECLVKDKQEWEIEKIDSYNLESLKRYYEYLKTSTREKDIPKRAIVEKALEKCK